MERFIKRNFKKVFAWIMAVAVIITGLPNIMCAQKSEVNVPEKAAMLAEYEGSTPVIRITQGNYKVLTSYEGSPTYPPMGAITRIYLWDKFGSGTALSTSSIELSSSGQTATIKAVSPGECYVTCKVQLSYKYRVLNDFLYACEDKAGGTWKIIVEGTPVTVYLDANGGDISQDSITLNKQGKYGELPTPTRDRYTFLGWYTAAEGGDKISDKTIVTGSCTIYAHWSKNHTVTFDPNGGTVDVTSKIVYEGGTYGDLPTPVTDTATEGKIFTAWYTAASGGTKVSTKDKYNLTDNQTLYAHWGDKITLDANGGTLSDTEYVVEIGMPYGELPTPTLEKYNFLGWFTDEADGKLVTNTTTVTNLKNLRAKWGENTSGVCGDNLTWRYDPRLKAIIISGTGEMYNYDTKYDSQKKEWVTTAPWGDYRKDVSIIYIEEGATSIGDYAFYKFDNHMHVRFPDTLDTIGKRAFYEAIVYELTLPKNLRWIKEYAFCGLQTVGNPTLPKSVQIIDTWALKHSMNYTEYLCYSGTSEQFKAIGGTDDFPKKYYNEKYYVGEGMLLLAECDIMLDDSACIYDGTAKLPVFTIKDRDKELEDDTDYDTYYIYGSDNIDVGEYLIRVVGGGVWDTFSSGEYYGAVLLKYTIKPAPIDDYSISLSQDAYVYDGSPCEPEVTVSKDGEILEPENYTVTYSNNIDAGKATVTVTGCGNYGGTLTKEFSIGAASIDGYIALLAEDSIYDGSKKQPEIILKKGDDVMPASNYSVAYSDNVDVGTATAVITCKNNFAGTITKTFEISPRSLNNEDFTVKFSPESCIYDGQAKQPAITLSFGDMVLGKEDYDITSYMDNIDVGIASVILTGKGNFCGEIMATFEILEPAPEEPAESEDTLKAEAAKAESLINAIGKVDASNKCKKKIDAARKAYDALSESAKSYVNEDVLSVLVEAEKDYKKAVKDAEKEPNQTGDDSEKKPNQTGDDSEKKPNQTGDDSEKEPNQTGDDSETKPTTPEQQKEVENIRKKLGLSAEDAKKLFLFARENDISEETLLITDKSILNKKGDGDIKGSSFVKIQAQTSKLTNKAITIKWNKVKGADGYKIYGNQCGKKCKLIKTITKSGTVTFTQKKLKKGTYYKYIVIAYKNVGKNKVTIAASKTIHATTAGGKYGVAKSVKVNKKSITLGKNKTFKIKASEVKKDKKIKQHRGILYESGNKKIATVSKNGVIKGINKGTCVIYVYSQNGAYAKVKVKVQ